MNGVNHGQRVRSAGGGAFRSARSENLRAVVAALQGLSRRPGPARRIGATIDDWLESLPRQLAGNDLRRVSDHLCRANREGRTVAAALGGHVIKTGCAPYLIDWIDRGVLKAVALNGSAAIHDFELALAGKTSEDVAAQLPTGQFGMARETADAFAVAARAGSRKRRRPRRGAGPLPRRAQLPACRMQPGAGRLSGRHSLHRPRRPGHRHRPHAPARLRGRPRRSVADRLPPAVHRRRRR